jgi:predicted ATP-grasp superfamily ATP-dependent carboligase
MIDHREEVIELGRRLLVGAGVRGVANVEFKRDARDGQLKLIECNLRFTAANELVRHAGIDLAALAYARVTGRPDPPLSGYRAGVRLWNPLPDVRSLVAHRRQGDLTVARWIASLLRPLHLPLWSWRDPGPSIRVVARRTRRLVARRPRATQRSEAVRVTT